MRTHPMADPNANDDLKAKMREALDRKKANGRDGASNAQGKEKAHGSEVVGGAPKGAIHARRHQ
jgi:hypothetical protein